MKVKLGTLDQSMSKGYTEHGTEEWEEFRRTVDEKIC